jgi:hypothetical protein
MTSWNRGKENEEEGERKMNKRDAEDKVEGAVQKVAGEVEQGADNLGDYLSGKQSDLDGDNRNMTNDRDRNMRSDVND